VGSEPSANSSVSKVSLHHTEFALGIALPPIKLNLLVLYHLEFALMCSIPINISDNTRILEIDDSIVNEKLQGGGGVENVEVVVFDPRMIEVWSEMCTCMERDGVLRVAALANPYKVSINADLSEGDVACHLILTILIEEYKWVLPHITVVVLAPSSSWMVWVVKLFSELRDVGDRTRCGQKGNGGVILSESDWFIALYVVVQHVTLNFVKDLGNEKKVFHGGVVAERSSEHLVVKLSIPQNVQCWEEVLHPS